MARSGLIAAVLVVIVALAALGYLYSTGDLENMAGEEEKKGGGTDVTENDPPTGRLFANRTEVRVKEPINFSAKGSEDPNEATGGYIDRYRFDMGDGTNPIELFSEQLAGAEPALEYNYSIPKTYTVTLTCIDDLGAQSDPVTKTITVRPENINLRDTYFLSARAIDTEEVSFNLSYEALSVSVNVTFTPVLGISETCSASVWLTGPDGGVLMNESADMGPGQVTSFPYEFSDTQRKYLGPYLVTMKCTQGRIQYTYEIEILY